MTRYVKVGVPVAATRYAHSSAHSARTARIGCVCLCASEYSEFFHRQELETGKESDRECPPVRSYNSVMCSRPLFIPYPIYVARSRRCDPMIDDGSPGMPIKHPTYLIPRELQETSTKLRLINFLSIDVHSVNVDLILPCENKNWS